MALVNFEVRKVVPLHKIYPHCEMVFIFDDKVIVEDTEFYDEPVEYDSIEVMREKHTGLSAKEFERSYFWMDMGTFKQLKDMLPTLERVLIGNK